MGDDQHLTGLAQLRQPAPHRFGDATGARDREPPFFQQTLRGGPNHRVIFHDQNAHDAISTVSVRVLPCAGPEKRLSKKKGGGPLLCGLFGGAARYLGNMTNFQGQSLSMKVLVGVMT
jgi:hypothetical protein